MNRTLPILFVLSLLTASSALPKWVAAEESGQLKPIVIMIDRGHEKELVYSINSKVTTLHDLMYRLSDILPKTATSPETSPEVFILLRRDVDYSKAINVEGMATKVGFYSSRISYFYFTEDKDRIQKMVFSKFIPFTTDPNLLSSLK